MAMTMSGLAATGVLNRLNKNESAREKSLKNLASGVKIGGAADDASGYAISKRMSVQIRGLEQDSDNTQNGISMMKTAEGAMQSTLDILKTLKEKAINAANDTNSDTDRATIQKEIDEALDQIDENANVTFNGQTMIDGSKNNEVIGDGTPTYLTNKSLADGTGRFSTVVELQAKDGEPLGIMPGDSITISYIKDGKTYHSTKQIDDGTAFIELFAWDPCTRDLDVYGTRYHGYIGDDQSGNPVYTADGRDAISFHAKGKGVENQIAGLTVCVSAPDGTPRTSANAVINNFEESIRAQNPSPDNALTFQIGTKSNQSVRLGFSDLRAEALGLKSSKGDTIQVTTQIAANTAINAFDNAVSKVLNEQTKVGSFQSRLDYTNANITTAHENTVASESTIQDADMAQEAMNFAKHNVLTQSAQAMLAQANQSASSVLSLLQ